MFLALKLAASHQRFPGTETFLSKLFYTKQNKTKTLSSTIITLLYQTKEKAKQTKTLIHHNSFKNKWNHSPPPLWLFYTKQTKLKKTILPRITFIPNKTKHSSNIITIVCLTRQNQNTKQTSSPLLKQTCYNKHSIRSRYLSCTDSSDSSFQNPHCCVA